MEKEQLEKRKKVIYDLMCDDLYVPMKIKELAILLDIPRENREELLEVLEALIDEGKIEVSRKGKYAKASGKIYTGTFRGNARGFGFVTVEGLEEDIFIPEQDTKSALDQDVVRICVKSGKTEGKRQEGTVLKIMSRGNELVVGTFQKQQNFGFVLPDASRFSKDVYVPGEYTKGAVTGHKVVVKLTDFGSENRNPEGKIVEILGHINDPGTDILAIIKGYGLPMEFPEEEMKYVEKIPEEVLEEEKIGRKDLRSLQTVTIDGEDAKDLDDAITLSKEGNLYHLGVHIADVSHYVKEKSPIDIEALKRGTSVYLVDRVIPMIPHKLSNGICSLNAGVDRLALSCIMDIDERGNVVGHEIAETLIQVDRRMTYTSVKKILEEDPEEMKKYEDFVPMFQLMEELAGILRLKRRKRGSIDFDFPETKVVLDEKGHPIEIKPYDRNVATKIIEDFMLIANETVAQDFYWQELPFLYRTHDNPDPEKIAKLATFIQNFGYGLKISQEEIHPKELQKLLENIDNTPEEPLISRLTLRSMKQARYTTACTGHFGLAAQYYCHFTSPIRRYPDLQIHRIIKENLQGKLREKRIGHYEQILPEVAISTSHTERRAEEAERETIKLKKAEYMEKRIGQVYEGVVSGMTAWGMYVELPNTVEGLVHMVSMKDDYYYYDEEHYELVGEHLGKRYKLGQTVKIKVSGVDKLTRNIDFELAKEEEPVWEESEEQNGQRTDKADRQ